MNIDIELYIKNLKRFMSTDLDSYNYFIGEKNEDKFYDLVYKYAEKNTETNGTPELNIEQFEEIRDITNNNKIEKFPLFFRNFSLN